MGTIGPFYFFGWLTGRVLSADDFTNDHRIVVALHETIRLMAEIDKTIDAHGGWPAPLQRKDSGKQQ